jgi:hypothetical protein
VSDEFTVPLCRKRHQELDKHGNEANWWANVQIAPIPIANAREASSVRDAGEFSYLSQVRLEAVQRFVSINYGIP